MKKSEQIREELKRIARENKGILKPEAVVNVAKKKNSILHNCFEWDDSVAGHNYRLWQARQLISVSVQYSETAQQNYDVFVSLSTDRQKSGYREVEQVLSNKALTEIMLRDALNEMNLFIEKYNRVKELAQVFEAMQMTLDKHATKKKTGNYLTFPKVSPVTG